jgi:hypothetical protein
MMLQRDNNDFGMQFERAPDMVAVDVVSVWKATNAVGEKSVRLIENTLGQWELWIGGKFIQQFVDSETAARHAESMVAFRVKMGEEA